MAALIVALGLVTVHAFATAILWFEFRSREKRSIERIDHATDRILEAIGLLRGDLAPAPSGGPGGGGPAPGPGASGEAPALARSAASAVEAVPQSAVPTTKPARSRERPQPLRAIHDDPTLASAEDAPTSAELRAAFHAEADERDARHGARPAVPPPAPVGAPAANDATTGDAAVLARFQGAPRPTDEHGEVTLRRAPEALPRADVEDGDRETDEEGTRVYSRDPDAADAMIPGVPVVQKPPATTSTARPPHAPPRRTLLGGLAGAAVERPKSSATRAAADFAARTAPREPSWVEKRSAQLAAGGAGIDPAEAREQAERESLIATAALGSRARRDRDTLTPTDPSARPLDARVSRRWAELVAAAQAKGEDAAHCHGTLCAMQGDGVALCNCQCDACGLLLGLLVRAERDVRREQGEE